MITMDKYQHTLKKTVRFGGVGLHSGEAVNLTVKPAAANCGVCFVRTDQQGHAPIPAFMNRVVSTILATTLANGGVSVSTTEHLLAALVGLGIDNAIIELDGPEVPILDGSAGPFVLILRKAGRLRQKARRRFLKITREITFQDGDKTLRVLPYDGFKVTSAIEFDHPLIRRQSCTMEISADTFAREVASARTFGFLDEVEKLQENGLALGGSLDNAIVVDRFGILNNEGLRFPDEFVRHKVLDLIGDLALLGYPLLGHVIANKSGHGQHLGLMQAIASQPDCWEMVSYDTVQDSGVLERVVMSTRAAGSRLMPLLVPPATLSNSSCAA
jgi:UDP-3-O-[3-hydroxymyristoyl] N-acetylglucosamine deacetylase